MTDTITTTYICPPSPDRDHDWHAYFSWQDADNLSCEGYGKTELDAKFALLQAAMDVDEDGSEQEAILEFAWHGLKAAETIKAAEAETERLRNALIAARHDLHEVEAGDLSTFEAQDAINAAFRATQEKNDG